MRQRVVERIKGIHNIPVPYGTVLTSGAYKLGTSPAFKILLMSSTMRSLIILKQAEEKNVKTIKLTIKRLE